jgi:hypothetical protein
LGRTAKCWRRFCNPENEPECVKQANEKSGNFFSVLSPGEIMHCHAVKNV